MKRKPHGRLLSRRTTPVKSMAGPEGLLAAIDEIQAGTETAHAHVERVLREAEAAKVDPDLADLHADVVRAATVLRHALAISKDPHVIASAALEFGDRVATLNIEATLGKSAILGFKMIEGGRKGGRETARDPRGQKRDALISKARKLLRDGVPPRELARECVEQGLSAISVRRTRDVLQGAGLVPRRMKRT